MKRIFCSLSLGLVLLLQLATGQNINIQMRGPDGKPLPGDNVMGKVTKVSSDSIVINNLNGSAITIKVSDQTRVMQGREPTKVSDIHVDDVVFARGQLSGAVMNALVVSKVDPAMTQRMQQGPMGGMSPEDLGKKFIAGEVKAIDELKLTIAMPNQKTQTIEVDENTSFKKGSESVTLADIKVGDFVRGPGELKSGVFVPRELSIGRPQMRMIRGPGSVGSGGRGDDAAIDNRKPDDKKPAETHPK